METRLVEVIERSGPQTGAELKAALGDESFLHWRSAVMSERLAVRRVGSRYLRLDRRVEGFARLSPSILREFLTYTVVGLASDEDGLEARTLELSAHVREVSRRKYEMARQVARTVGEAVAPWAGGGGESGGERGGGKDDAGADAPFCILLAGDVVYDMAHDVPRPERSTGRMVRGSDLDLVVVVADEALPEVAAQLDELMYRQKYRYLINPAAREEIDYVVKPLSRVQEQAAFDSFPRMVACKILEEAVLVYGSARLFRQARALLEEQGVRARLRDMEALAACERREAEARLLASEEPTVEGPDAYVFFTAEESEEFE